MTLTGGDEPCTPWYGLLSEMQVRIPFWVRQVSFIPLPSTTRITIEQIGQLDTSSDRVTARVPNWKPYPLAQTWLSHKSTSMMHPNRGCIPEIKRFKSIHVPSTKSTFDPGNERPKFAPHPWIGSNICIGLNDGIIWIRISADDAYDSQPFCNPSLWQAEIYDKPG